MPRADQSALQAVWDRVTAFFDKVPGAELYPHHLTASEAGRIAREAQVKRLAPTHIPPHLDPARSVHEAELAFDRPVRLAAPGARFDV